jgi:hypothetical protein
MFLILQLSENRRKLQICNDKNSGQVMELYNYPYLAIPRVYPESSYVHALEKPAQALEKSLPPYV